MAANGLVLVYRASRVGSADSLPCPRPVAGQLSPPFIQLFIYLFSMSPYNCYLEIPSPDDVLDLDQPPHLPPPSPHLSRLLQIRHHVDKIRRRDQRSQQRPDEERYQPYDDNRPQRESLLPQHAYPPSGYGYPSAPVPFGRLLLHPRDSTICVNFRSFPN